MNKLKVLLLSLSLLIFAAPTHAQEAFEINDFQVDLEILENGQLNVTESIEVEFSEERHGIFRDIPGNGISIDIKDVTDDNNESRTYLEEYFSQGTRLRIGDADKYVNGEQTYKIAYEVNKAIRFFPTHDELYWNTTGNYWETTIHQTSTTVQLPASVQGSQELRFKCFTGYDLSGDEDCKYQYNPETNTATFTANNPLPSYNGMTIVLGMPKGTLPHPGILEVNSNKFGANVYLNDSRTSICSTPCKLDSLAPGDYTVIVKTTGYKASPQRVEVTDGGYHTLDFELHIQTWFVVFILLLTLLFFAIIFEPIYTFRKKGRDPKGRGTIIPYYESPNNLSPAELGTLVDERADLKDLSSTIIDLAVRGYIIIKVIPDKTSWVFKKDDHELIKVAEPDLKGGGLSDFESLLMKDIFGSSDKKKISALSNHFYSKLPKLKEKLYKKMIDKKLFSRSPEKTRTLYLVKGLLVLFFLGIGLPIVELAVFGSAFSLSFLLNGIITLVLAPFMPKKTAKGVDFYEKILGFKLYLETAEKHRLEFQEKEHLFYKYLPYAMTLGIAEKWTKAFKEIFDKAPEWYQGAGIDSFQPIGFVNNMSNISSNLQTAFRSRPSTSGSGGSSSWSSSSSGFSSGGSSGGGFGGGGGGSW